MAIEWQKPTIDAAIVIAGAALVNTYVVGKVAAIASLMANFPVFMGISTAAIVEGAVVLILVKKYLMR